MQAAERLQQGGEVLARFACTDEKQVRGGQAMGRKPAVSRRRRAEPGGVHAERCHGHQLRIQPVGVDGLGRDRLAGGDDGGSTAQATRNQLAITRGGRGDRAGQLQIRQIVDGQHAAGPPRWRQHEVRSVYHVGRAGHPLQFRQFPVCPRLAHDPGRNPARGRAYTWWQGGSEILQPAPGERCRCHVQTGQAGQLGEQVGRVAADPGGGAE